MAVRTKTAILIGLVLVPVILVKTIIPMMVLGLVLVIVGSFEYRKLTNSNYLGVALSTITYITIITLQYLGLINSYVSIVIYSLIGIILLYVLYSVLTDSKMRIPNLILNIIYIGLGISSLVLLKMIDTKLIIYLIVLIAMTDSFAYFLGMKYGKHKIAPTISPKKSVEGCIAGFVGSIIVGILLVLIMNLNGYWIFSNIGYVILFSAFISTMGQIGDLFASKIKRLHNVKDFGSIFPGHGGVLDRVDSWVIGAMIIVLFII